MSGFNIEKIDAIIRILEDGKEHSIEEISETSGVSPEKVEALIKFLSKYNFVFYDEKRRRTRISDDFLRLK